MAVHGRRRVSWAGRTAVLWVVVGADVGYKLVVKMNGSGKGGKMSLVVVSRGERLALWECAVVLAPPSVAGIGRDGRR